MAREEPEAAGTGRLVEAGRGNYGASPRRRRRRQGCRASRGRPAPHPAAECGGRWNGGPQSWHGAVFVAVSRVSSGAAKTPRRRGARARHASPPVATRPGPGHAPNARRPPDRACDRRPLPKAVRPGGGGRRPEGFGASRGASAGSGGARPGIARVPPARSNESTQGRPSGRPAAKRKGSRMVTSQPRRRSAGPATHLRRSLAMRRCGAESPLP